MSILTENGKIRSNTTTEYNNPGICHKSQYDELLL